MMVILKLMIVLGIWTPIGQEIWGIIGWSQDLLLSWPALLLAGAQRSNHPSHFQALKASIWQSLMLLKKPFGYSSFYEISISLYAIPQLFSSITRVQSLLPPIRPFTLGWSTLVFITTSFVIKWRVRTLSSIIFLLDDQVAVILTKALPFDKFSKFRSSMGLQGCSTLSGHVWSRWVDVSTLRLWQLVSLEFLEHCSDILVYWNALYV